MAHYDIFRGQLASKYPAYGHALWEPSPPRPYSPVEIGDVGFIREGRFHRLFNALLSADHPSHTFGVPEYHEPLIPKLSDHIIHGTLSTSHYYSVGIDVAAAESVWASSPDDCPQASFLCKNKRGGAVLSLPVSAQRQDTLAREAFGKWMVTNIDRWFAFVRQLELGIEQMEELILVTGCDRARSWLNAAFLKNQVDAQVSFGVHVSPGLEGGINWQFSPERIRGAVLNQGPTGKNLPENQGVFIRGFRVARTFGIFPRHLRAAAEPSPDDDRHDWDTGPDVELISIPAVVKYQDPLQFIFEYVARRAPECDMILVHDDDLARISGICDGDVVGDCLQRSNAEIHTDLFHLSAANNANSQVVRVAMLSHEPDLAPQLSLLSLSSEIVDPHYTSEWSTGIPQKLQGDEDDSSNSPTHANMSGHKYSSKTTIPSHHAAVVSVDAAQASLSTSLLHIPSELLIRILLYLPSRDIISCGRTCRRLYDLCRYPALRYLVQMERSAVSDDMRPGLGYLERLRILEKREEAWAMLDFRRSVQVSVPFESTGVYDFTGGAFLLGTRIHCVSPYTTVGYSYVSLPSLSDPQDQNLEWKGLSLGIQIMEVGLAVHEHDLLATLTASKADAGHPSDRSMTLEIQLLSFSTGQPHPLAEQPIIFITTKSLPLGRWNALIEIVGEFLALLITFPTSQNENEDMIFLVYWKKGETHCLRSSEGGTYACFNFLSQDTLMIANLIQNTLEVAEIVIDSDDKPRLVPLCVLHLPTLAERASIVRLGCRAEPNPTSSSPLAIPAPLDRPFRDKAEDAIILFNVLIEDVHLHVGQFHLPAAHPFTFVVHRHALLAHISAAHRAYPPFCSTPLPAPLPVQVPWAAWGPAATRWFEGDPMSMRWIATTAGQRAVTIEGGTSTPIIVQDFNPYAVRSARARAATSGRSQQCNWSEQLPNGNRMTLKVEDSVLLAGSVFEEDMRSSLPYVEIVTRAEYHYEGVLIDEERILGLKPSEQHKVGISSFDIHVLG